MTTELESPSDHEVGHVLEMAATLVAAFVSNNSVPVGDLPALIASVHTSLSGVARRAPKVEAAALLLPAISIKKSVSDDFIICLEDGKKFKSLRRHLNAAYGLTPDQYRRKWGLPPDYPMVAPAYAAKRSALAKEIGLGTPKGERRPKPARKKVA